VAGAPIKTCGGRTYIAVEIGCGERESLRLAGGGGEVAGVSLKTLNHHRLFLNVLGAPALPSYLLPNHFPIFKIARSYV
jgi:hypothetical protein